MAIIPPVNVIPWVTGLLLLSAVFAEQPMAVVASAAQQPVPPVVAAGPQPATYEQSSMPALQQQAHMSTAHTATSATQQPARRAVVSETEPAELAPVQELAFATVTSGFLQSGETIYFDVTIPPSVDRVRVKLFAMSGDPDAFLSFTHSRPDDSSASWSMEDLGPEEKVIDRHSTSFCTSEPCVLHIAVNGFDEAHYALGVFQDDQPRQDRSTMRPGRQARPTDLTLHEVAFGSSLVSAELEAGQTTFYSVTIPPSVQFVKVELVPASGDPDLFLSFRNSHPTSASSEWQLDDVGPEQAILRRGSPGFCLAEPCVLHLAAYGFSASEFEFRVSEFERPAPVSHNLQQPSELEQPLALGVPFSGRLDEDEMAFFQCVVPPSVQAIVVKLIPQSGDPDAYLSFQFAQPDEDVAPWVLDDLGAEEKRLSRELPEFCAAEPCVLHITVFGYDATEYSIGVFEDHSSFPLPLPLVPALPGRAVEPPASLTPLPAERRLQLGRLELLELAEGTAAYFAVPVPASAHELQVRLLTVRGEAVVLLSFERPRPDLASATLQLDDVLAQDARLRRAAGDFCRSEPCTLHLSVVARSSCELEFGVLDVPLDAAGAPTGDCAAGCARRMVGNGICDEVSSRAHAHERERPRERRRVARRPAPAARAVRHLGSHALSADPR